MKAGMTRFVVAIALMAGGSANSRATPPSQSSEPPKARSERAAGPVHPPNRRPDTWYQFMLRQFNPHNVDYGSRLERERRAFVEERLKNPYFLYSLGTTFAMMMAAAVGAKLCSDHRRAMWITAEMMADIYNQDAYSRRIAHEAIRKYNTHIERCNRAIEAIGHGRVVPPISPEIEQLRNELVRVVEEKDAAVRDRDIARNELRRKSEILAELSVRLESVTNKPRAAGTAKSFSDLRAADAKLVTHMNALEEQLPVERSSNRSLRGG